MCAFGSFTGRSSEFSNVLATPNSDPNIHSQQNILQPTNKTTTTKQQKSEKKNLVVVICRYCVFKFVEFFLFFTFYHVCRTFYDTTLVETPKLTENFFT